MKTLRALLVAVVLVAMSLPAVAGKMAKAKGEVSVEPGKATVVFMRPGKLLGAAIGVPVWDVTTGDPAFIGIVDAGGKVAYSVPAGEHTFMTTVVGGDAGVRFQKAIVEAGKVYYFRAHIMDGIWGLDPVRGSDLDGKAFAGWDKKTTLLENSPKTLAWAEDALPDAERKSGLRPSEIPMALTLNVEDGRTLP